MFPIGYVDDPRTFRTDPTEYMKTIEVPDFESSSSIQSEESSILFVSVYNYQGVSSHNGLYVAQAFNIS